MVNEVVESNDAVNTVLAHACGSVRELRTTSLLSESSITTNVTNTSLEKLAKVVDIEIAMTKIVKNKLITM